MPWPPAASVTSRSTAVPGIAAATAAARATGVPDAAIAEALRTAVGREAALGVPIFAATGGFLTGGGATANAMLMPMVTALARALALDPFWVAAVQNAACANLTMLSPIRISMGTAILGLAISDAELYRRAWPLALPPLIAGFAAIALLLVA